MRIAERTDAALGRLDRSALKFFLLWLRKPVGLGAALPSGGPLARAMAREIDSTAPGAVVELGGGTGVITQALLDAGIAPEDLIVIEREPELFAILRDRFPQLAVVKADARDLAGVLRARGIARVKAVASGLPLLNIPDPICREIVSQAFSVMEADGLYLQYTYGPTSPLPRRLWGALGVAGRRVSWVPMNLPPASVWRYRKKSPAA
jgi:phosphatidylethanolamine/phosphatidyl-N-methylethanolamine N-methyltransferase